MRDGDPLRVDVRLDVRAVAELDTQVEIGARAYVPSELQAPPAVVFAFPGAVFVLPRSARCFNLADTRTAFDTRLAAWVRTSAAVSRAPIPPYAYGARS